MNQSPYRAIFFDLDGTLLPMDLDEFLQGYMGTLERFVDAHGLDGKAFSKALNAGIRAMAFDDSPRSNAEVFWEAFFKGVLGTTKKAALKAISGKPATKTLLSGQEEASGQMSAEMQGWLAVFEDFYENHFGAIGQDTLANPFAARSIEVLAAKGYPLVLATMPMFPLRAVEWRCAWAKVDPAVFVRITHFENSTSIKPKHAYFQENLKATGLAPHEVLMVGNNTREDLACLGLGMDAYLITDHLIDPVGFDLSTVKHGSFEDFLAWTEGLPPCGSPATCFEKGLVAAEQGDAQGMLRATAEDATEQVVEDVAIEAPAKEDGVNRAVPLSKDEDAHGTHPAKDEDAHGTF
ncbi:MAG: HAD family hydrolase [Coriobacteriaceae bacterium]|jgi:FMN phosphatase YigB (HAD superfamily)|nr:HAD family hydrolase [Coriobacteriaceae bacterium]